uniref:Ig-like domain-containing protein n=1 Tax=Vombatus ursinus TaxID=29139 RepID=A0A4X2JSA7_VOMUR
MTKYYLWFLLFYLFTEPRASRENDAPVMVTGILGESAILPTEIPNGYKLENINWASRTSVALVQPEGQSVKIITTHQNYRDRLNVPPNTYNLKISPLKMEDAGSYRADINLQNPTTSTTFTITKNYTLHVYRQLAPPKITLTFVASENNTCNISLTCFMEEGGEAVKYQWTPLGEQAVESNGKSSLFIFQRPKDAPINYTCTAINPVTNNSQSKFVQYPCAGTLVIFDPFWYTLLSVLEMVIVIILTGMGFYLRHKKKQGRLAPPKITLTFVASENNTCNITLTCFMEEKGEAVKYQWTPLGEQAVESNGKSSLFIFQRPEDAPINYICTAINPVTNNSQSKLVQYPCADADSPSTSKVMALKDLPLSENQLYDEISMPKAIVSNPPKEEEALNTIYYTVQKPQKIKNSCSSATKLLGTSTNDSVI